jgi:hypothetical protein
LCVCAALWLYGGDDVEYFREHEAEYGQAAASVLAGVRGNASLDEVDLDLPREYAHLSENGEIWLAQLPGGGHELTFYRSRGILGQWSGYLYVSDPYFLNQSMAHNDESSKLGPNWAWAREY